MGTRRRFLLLAAFMSLATTAVVAVSVGLLYQASMSVRRQGLLELATDRASLVETIASSSDQTASMRDIRRAFQQAPGLGKSGEVTLARRRGDRIEWLTGRRFGPPTAVFSLPIGSDLAKPMQRALHGGRGTMIGRDYRGRTVLAGYALVPGPGWAVVAKMDLAEARAPFWRAGLAAIALTLLLVVVGAAAFVGMTSPIVKRLKASEERYRSLFEQSPIGIYCTTSDGRVLLANPALLDMLGYESLEELSSRNLEQSGFEPDYPRQLFKEAMEAEGRVRGFEAAWTRRNGEPVFVSENADAIRAADGATLYYEGTVEDITDRKRAEDELRRLNAELEDRVRQRTAQLEATNEELESFAYSVSHDLRAPLRAIDGFAQALLEDCAEQLDEEGRSHLDRVRTNAQRMGRLIDDLLTMSRVMRGTIHPEEVSISALAAAVVKDLRRGDPDRRVDIVISEGLTATADPRLIELVLANLLGNAWKFTADRARARITVDAIEQDGEAVFFVRDDGAGFDMAYSDKLFGAFQRLHSSAQFEGTGIGLATVQRIVHRHGGRIWGEGAVGKGATFYFTLAGGSQGAL